MAVPEETDSRHLPVLLDEVLENLDVKAGGTYCDGTFGAGGYTRAILAQGAGQVMAIDRDPTAIADGQALVAASQGRLTLMEGRFGDVAALAGQAGLSGFDGMVFDIGVSSMQIDRPERGFSFRFDGPLDMRMAMSGESAADLVARLPEGELADLIYRYGEERLSRPIARALVAERAIAPIVTTRRLAEIIARVVRVKPNDIHPATRTFQALRIAVNDELGELERALAASLDLLKPGGRLVVVTFHSLEDRIVKHFLAEQAGKTPSGSRHAPALQRQAPRLSLITRKPVEASEAETRRNPRARSARLRAAQMLGETMGGLH